MGINHSSFGIEKPIIFVYADGLRPFEISICTIAYTTVLQIQIAWNTVVKSVIDFGKNISFFFVALIFIKAMTRLNIRSVICKDQFSKMIPHIAAEECSQIPFGISFLFIERKSRNIVIIIQPLLNDIFGSIYGCPPDIDGL